MKTCTLHEYKLLKYLYHLWRTIDYALSSNKVIYKKILIISQIKFIQSVCDISLQNVKCRIVAWHGFCTKCTWKIYNKYCRCTIVS